MASNNGSQLIVCGFSAFGVAIAMMGIFLVGVIGFTLLMHRTPLPTGWSLPVIFILSLLIGLGYFVASRGRPIGKYQQYLATYGIVMLIAYQMIMLTSVSFPSAYGLLLLASLATTIVLTIRVFARSPSLR